LEIDMISEPTLPNTDPALEASLDGALAIAFRAPSAPADLRAHVLAAVARDRAPDWEHCRHELEKDYRSSIANLNARYLRRCRDALVAGSVIVITIGLAVKPLSHWLTQLFESSAPLVAGLVALSMGLFFGAIIMQDLFGRLQSAGLRA
jgi:hypothetical protein